VASIRGFIEAFGQYFPSRLTVDAKRTKSIGLSLEKAMQTVNMHEAKTQLSKLVARASGGEAIVIAKGGKPAARLVPIEEAVVPKKRKLGWLQGQIDVPGDIKTPFRDEIDGMFGGNPDKFK
jgi:prevent-host-death family protein